MPRFAPRDSRAIDQRTDLPSMDLSKSLRAVEIAIEETAIHAAIVCEAVIRELNAHIASGCTLKSDANLAPSEPREGDQKMHDKDREIIDVAEHTDQVMFQKSTRPTQSGVQAANART